MHKLILWLGLALLALLQGCATTGQPQAVPLQGGASTGDAVMVGTLATTPCELATAPGITAIFSTRLKALRWARRGQISVAQLQSVQDLADKARGSLPLACMGDEVNKLGAALFLADVAVLVKTLENYRADR
ncbi:MAG: hypothetical protein KIT35_22020 [Piscinibacter sp.]|uniref:hypothetical protein n=1 Tax=Piscinibacter sp. TaxID=1903157 RepID=UPI0025867DA9|nr:hypothetical protein [Piscinibacter sp.]MCW5666518.1 hypothetical protein [Piscinibacter sp.]